MDIIDIVLGSKRGGGGSSGHYPFEDYMVDVPEALVPGGDPVLITDEGSVELLERFYLPLIVTVFVQTEENIYSRYAAMFSCFSNNHGEKAYQWSPIPQLVVSIARVGTSWQASCIINA